MATVKDIAAAVGVSVATVSNVLNGRPNVGRATRQRVLRIAQQLDYRPNRAAQAMRTGRTRAIGLVLPDLTNPFFPELIDAFESLAAARGIEVIFTHTNYDPKRLQSCIRRMVERNVDAIAVMTSEVEEAALKQASVAGVPLVLMNQRAASSSQTIPVILVCKSASS